VLFIVAVAVDRVVNRWRSGFKTTAGFTGLHCQLLSLSLRFTCTFSHSWIITEFIHFQHFLVFFLRWWTSCRFLSRGKNQCFFYRAILMHSAVCLTSVSPPVLQTLWLYQNDWTY